LTNLCEGITKKREKENLDGIATSMDDMPETDASRRAGWISMATRGAF
jgi:hypothetical protein